MQKNWCAFNSVLNKRRLFVGLVVCEERRNAKQLQSCRSLLMISIWYSQSDCTSSHTESPPTRLKTQLDSCCISLGMNKTTPNNKDNM